MYLPRHVALIADSANNSKKHYKFKISLKVICSWQGGLEASYFQDMGLNF